MILRRRLDYTPWRFRLAGFILPPEFIVRPFAVAEIEAACAALADLRRHTGGLRFAARTDHIQTVKRLWGRGAASFASALAVKVAESAWAPKGGRDPHRGCILSSPFGVADAAFQYEKTGLTEGWHLIDAFRLAHTVPSSPAAALSLAIGAAAFSVSQQDGHLSSLRAVDRAATALARGEAARVAVALVEDASDYVVRILLRRGDRSFLARLGDREAPLIEMAALLEAAGDTAGEAPSPGFHVHAYLEGPVAEVAAQCHGLMPGAEAVIFNSLPPSLAATSGTLPDGCALPVIDLGREWGDFHGAFLAGALCWLLAHGRTAAVVIARNESGHAAALGFRLHA